MRLPIAPFLTLPLSVTLLSVTFLAAASAQPTVTGEDTKKAAHLEIKSITPDSKFVLQRAKKKFQVFLVGQDGQRADALKQARWSTSDANKLDVADNGIVTGIAVGTVDLIAESQGLQARLPLQVLEDPTDLDVTFIERLPRYDYDAPKNNPVVGDRVTFRGHLRNWGPAAQAIEYHWLLDGKVVEANAYDSAAPNEERVVEWQWTWQEGPHTIGLWVDPNGKVQEASETNNRIVDRTNGLAVGFWVEQSLYDDFHERQRTLGLGSNSWDDWAQRQMSVIWNRYSANAIWPTSPQGILDRVRIDKITLVPDGALPLAGGIAGNHPDLRDKTVDLMWGFPVSAFDPRFYDGGIGTTTRPSVWADGGWAPNFLFVEHSLTHELGHARYLGHHDDECVREGVEVLENGQPLAGSPLLPFYTAKVVFFDEHGGVMAGPYGEVPAWSPAEAGALNRIAGIRARQGNYNSPGTGGEYRNDVPRRFALRFVRRDGTPYANAGVRVYIRQREGRKVTIDNIPEMEGTTDQQGRISCDGALMDTNRSVALIRIESQGQIFIRFLEIHDLNLRYWMGEKEEPTITYELLDPTVGADLEIFGFGHKLVNGQNPSLIDHTDFGSVPFCPVPLPDEATQLVPYAVRAFIFKNAGNANLSWTLKIEGPHAGDFALNDDFTERRRNGGADFHRSIPTSIRFIPQAPGVREATVNVTSNAKNAPTFSFKIRGIGVVQDHNPEVVALEDYASQFGSLRWRPYMDANYKAPAEVVRFQNRLGIADTGNKRVVIREKRDQQWRTVQVLDGFEEPAKLAFSTDGWIAVGDRKTKTAVVITPSGRRIPVSGFQLAVKNLAFQPDGKLAITDLLNKTTEFDRKELDPGKDIRWLEEFDLTKATSASLPVKAGRSVEGNALKVQGKIYYHGFGTTAPGDFALDLKGIATRFQALVGLDDESQKDSAVSFEVWLDGKKVAESPVMVKGAAPYKFDVDLTGAKTLGLRAVQGSKTGWDHGDWLDAQVQMKLDAQELPVAIPLR